MEKQTVRIGGLVLGDGIPKICVPVAAENRRELDRMLDVLKDKRELYDFVEFRADLYPEVPLSEVPDLLEAVKDAAGLKPVLFTFRTRTEGGNRDITFCDYRDLNLCAARHGAGLVDLELRMVMEEDQKSPKHPGSELLRDLQRTGARVIGSFHDFRGTPSADELVKKMVLMQDTGFDISKIAVMPRDREDVLELLFASASMQEDWADRPYITMSMGDLGEVTRSCGSFSGSCVTFGTLGKASAPGQIEAEALRRILPCLQEGN